MRTHSAEIIDDSMALISYLRDSSSLAGSRKLGLECSTWTARLLRRSFASSYPDLRFMRRRAGSEADSRIGKLRERGIQYRWVDHIVDVVRESQLVQSWVRADVFEL